MILIQSLNEHRFEGDNCYRVGNYKNALCWYNKALKKDPNSIILLTQKANTLIFLKKYTQAYNVYNKVFIQMDCWGVIDDYISRYSTDLTLDIHQLKELLVLNYKIPITQGGLQTFLKIRHEKINELKRIDEWTNYKKNLGSKPITSLEEYIDLFLHRFGENFHIHFWSFYCYLRFQKGFSIAPNRFADIIVKQRKKLELQQFERMLKRSRGKHSLDKMTGIEFESYLSTLFSEKGCVIEKTPDTRDFGADLVLERFGQKTVVQAKRTKAAVGIKAIQEISSARSWYNAERAIVITSSTFTKPAKDLANRVGVELWDRKRLLDEISKPGFGY